MLILLRSAIVALLAGSISSSANAFIPTQHRHQHVQSLRAGSAASSLQPTDANMHATYEALASRAAAAAAALPAGKQWWCAIAGGPGAGKSTLAQGVADACLRAHRVRAAVLPMDGFHFSRAELKRLDPPDAATLLPRRGAPATFDAEGLGSALAAAKDAKVAQLPTYSRELSDPVPGGAVLHPEDRIVLVEGNYLLLGRLFPSGAKAAAGEEAAAVAKEAARWRPLLPLFDETWFVAPEGGVHEQRRRLVARHLETWSPAKTKAWGASTDEEGAEKRTDFNDVPNAWLVDRCRHFEDHVVLSI